MEEVERLKWLIEVVQEVSDLPLCIDSSGPEVIESVLPLVKTRPMINSITLEPSHLEETLPLVFEYKTKVIALCPSQGAMAETTEAKVRMAGQLVERVKDVGIPLDEFFINPLIFPLPDNTKSALATLDAIEEITKRFPKVRTACSLTNVFHVLPIRKLVNRTSLVGTIACDLDSAISDSTSRKLCESFEALLMVIGKDEFCSERVRTF